MKTETFELVLRLFHELQSKQHSLVLAESCTAGLVAASFGQLPGVSEILCGSSVVYQPRTKTEWLSIDSKLLDDPDIGPESSQVTEALALAVLKKTSQATLSAAVTGHLGPIGESATNRCKLGKVFVAIASRVPDSIAADRSPTKNSLKLLSSETFELNTPAPQSVEDFDRRYIRQCEASYLVFESLLRSIDAQPPKK